MDKRRQMGCQKRHCLNNYINCYISNKMMIKSKKLALNISIH